MKLAFSTLGSPMWSLDDILRNAQAMGFAGVELRGIGGVMAFEEIADLSPSRRAETCQAFAQRGLVITNLGTSSSFHDPARVAEAMAEARTAIDICADMHVPAIRVFGDSIPDPAKEGETIEQISSCLRELCAYAGAEGVQVWQEVHGMFNTRERIAAVVEQVNSPHFGILWDVQHTDTVYEDDFMAFYEPLRSYIRHVHMKDHHRNGGAWQLCGAGEGDIPLLPIARRLLADGYKGFFSFEWEKVWHPELAPAEESFPQYVALMGEV